MAERTIPDLKGKLARLRDSGIAQQVGGYHGNDTSFGNATIGRSALRSLLTKNASTIDLEHERKIADRCKFKIDWPPWQTGAACDFIDAYERIHRNEIQTQRTDVLLVKGAPHPPEACKIKGLAAVELFLAQIGRGTACVGFDVSCGETRMFGVPVTLRVAEITWDCGGGQLDPETRKGRGIAYSPEGCSVKFRWNGADTFRPSWRLEAQGPSIGDIVVPPEFGTVVGLAPGSSITITFGIWRPDIEESETAIACAVVAEVGTISIPLDAGEDVDPAALSILKKRILTRIATDALERHGDFITLCRHTVSFLPEKKA